MHARLGVGLTHARASISRGARIGAAAVLAVAGVSAGLLAAPSTAAAADCVTYTCYDVGVSILGEGSGTWRTVYSNQVVNNKINCVQVNGGYTPTSVCHWTYEDYLRNGYIDIYYEVLPAAGSWLCVQERCDTEPFSASIRLSASHDFFAEFRPINYLVKLLPSGAGDGTVTSVPGAISCPGNCVSTFAWGTNVVLTALPATGSTFAGWTERCAGQDATCAFQATSAGTIGYAFGVASYDLTVTKSGSGSGGVFSTPAAISCGATCFASLQYGTSVLLTAIADPGSTFTRWTGACSGQPADCLIGVIAKTDTAAVFTSLSATAPPGPSTGPGVPSAVPGKPTLTLAPSALAPGASVPPDATGGTVSPAAGVTKPSAAATSPPIDPAVSTESDSTPIVLAILGAGLLIAIGIGLAGFMLRRRSRGPEAP